MKRLLTMIAGLVLGLAVSEAIMHAYDLGPAVASIAPSAHLALTETGESADFVFDPDPELRWRATDAPSTWGGREPLRTHVGILGDSEAYGYCVGRDNAPAALLARLDRGARVTNYGVSGYDAGQVARMAEVWIPQTAPPLNQLVWLWNANDEERTTYNALMVAREAGSIYAPAEARLIRVSRLYRLAWALWARPERATAPLDLDVLIRRVLALGVPLVIVPLPYGPAGGTATPSDPRPAATALGVPVMEPGAWTGEAQSWCDAAHLSLLGNVRLVVQLRDWLRRRGGGGAVADAGRS